MNRRKKQFVRFDVQLKVVLIALFVASFVLLIHFQLALSSFLSLSDRLSAATSIAAALEILRQELIRRFFLAFAIAIPLAVSVGVIYSFKFSGPVYRFKRYFTDLAGGRWDAPLALRKTDDLQDVCTAINAGLAPLRDRLRAHRE
ncbi:MAG: hypothetical protein HY721_01040, partial [Planctomycetes bacterium]|nr:hypothetical protein [Planctomycetota bacterium]